LNLQALTAYVVGVAVSLPFVTNGWYAGPLAERLGGSDVSWVPGLVVTGAVYLVVTRLSGARHVQPTPATLHPAVSGSGR
jgi:NCS1 family nucleobase:cation symporter-1